MSGKINVTAIGVAHLRTMRDFGRDRISWIDCTVFFLCPAFVSFVIFVSGCSLNSGLVSSLVNASAILLGLLLNLLVLMFDQRNKAVDGLACLENAENPDFNGKKRRLEVRCLVIDETVANISFTVLLCIFSLCTLLLFSMRAEGVGVDLIERIVYSINSFIWINVSLTILMVIKRVFALFSQV